MTRLAKYAYNEKGRDFVVGDIHGCFDLLSRMLAKIGFNKDVDRLFSVGDLVDRGPMSECALGWLDEPWFHAVRGNHEEMTIDGDPGLHFINGGAWFVSLSDDEQYGYRHVFSELPFAIEIETDQGRVGIVHAEVPRNDWNYLVEVLSASEAVPDHVAGVITWGRDLIRDHSDFEGIAGIDKVFVGHTPVKSPTTIGNVTYLDTGAVFKKALTIACIHGGELVAYQLSEEAVA